MWGSDVINLPFSSFALSPYNFLNKILAIQKIIDNGIEIIVKATDMVGWDTFMFLQSLLILVITKNEKLSSYTTAKYWKIKYVNKLVIKNTLF